MAFYRLETKIRLPGITGKRQERIEEDRKKVVLYMKGWNPGEKDGWMWKVPAAALLMAAVIGLAACGGGKGEGQPAEGERQAVEQQAAAEDSAGGGGEAPDMETEEEEEPEEAGTELPEEMQALADMGVPIPEKEVDFAKLQEDVNGDIYAWVYIPDTKIDYPVLQHPIDNYYYLNHNLDGSYGYPGCIYTESYNRRNFLDPLTVMYGHNMKNGTMFAGLHKYEDSEYFAGHPYIYVYTPERLLVYRVFASLEYGNEHLLYRRDYTREEEFGWILEKMEGVRGMNCNRAEDVEVTTDDNILILSTCMADKPDRRYLVQGVLLNEN